MPLNKQIPKYLVVGIFILAGYFGGDFSAVAGETSVIELSDGSVISGEVLAFDGSTWTIRSRAVGTLNIEAAKVVSIRSQAADSGSHTAGPSNANPVRSDQMQSMQQSIMANEQLMTMIMGLQNDPEIQAILEDPVIMQAVNDGDVNALLANPKFIKLLENRKIKAITREALKE